MRRLRILALALVALAACGGVAVAYLTAAGAGSASASVGALGAPSAVVATATPGSGTVPISWNAAPIVDGISPQGYYLLRTKTAGATAAACGTSPSALITATSCSDTSVADGEYSYTVVARYHSFTASAQSNAVTVVNDNVAPSVTVEQKSGQADPATTLPVRFTVIFSEPVTGFDEDDLTPGGTSTGGAVAVTGSGENYEIAVSGTPTDGTMTFAIAAGRAQDLAGNGNTASTSSDNSVAYDGTAPAVTLVAPADGSATNDTTPALSGAAGNAAGDAGTVTVRIFSGTGTAGTLLQTLTPTRTGASWSTTAAALAQGTYTVQAMQDDAVGNLGTSAANTFTVDTVAPTVTVNQKAGQSDPTNALPLLWTVTFSEPVTGFDASDLTRGGGSTGGTVSVSGSGASYEISLAGTPTSGTASFTTAAARAQDPAGNGNAASTSTDTTVTYDAVAPNLTLTTPANNSADNDTTPALAGAAGNATGDATTVTVKIHGGTGTAGTVVQTLTSTRSGASWSVNATTLPQGTYTAQATQADTAGNVATSSANTFVVDTTDPAVTINQKSGQDDPTNALPILYTVTFSEPVTGFASNDLSRGGTSGGTDIVSVTGSGASYEVSVSGTLTSGTLTYTINNDRVLDAAGNGNDDSTSTDNSVTYDISAPAVTLTTPANGSSTSDSTPALSGAAGNASGDATTVTVTIYNGTGTGGTVDQTLTPTRSGTTWTTTATTLADGTYTAQATQTDAVGNVGTSAANTFTIDTTAPTLSALAMLDNDADGRIDRVAATFSETLQSTTATAPWTLSGVPSAGSLNSVSRTGAVVTLALTEGAGAENTAVGTFQVALAASASGVRDLAGNQASFAATAPDDLAGPVLMTATSGGGTANQMQAGDTAVMTFSEALAPASVPSNLVVKEQRTSSSVGALTIPGLINSATINGNYLSANGASATSNTSPSTLSLGNTRVTVTLGTLTVVGGFVTTGSGGAGSVGPASSLEDVAGNAARTTSRPMSALF